MGRKKVNDLDKKVKIGISVDPEIPIYLKDRNINISSLINKLLKNYVNNGNQDL